MAFKKNIMVSVDLDGCSEKFAWYPIVTMPNKEESYMKNIQNGIRNSNFCDDVEDYYIPLKEAERVTRKINKNGEIKEYKKKVKIRGEYSGYVFVKCRMHERLWNLLRTTSGVSIILTTSGIPATLSDEEIEGIKQSLNREAKKLRGEIEETEETKKTIKKEEKSFITNNTLGEKINQKVTLSEIEPDMEEDDGWSNE